jgi:hypothetical protein
MTQKIHKSYRGYDLTLTALVMNPDAAPEKWRFIPVVAAKPEGTAASNEDNLLDMGTITPFATLEDCFAHAEFMAKRHIDRMLAAK